MDTKTIIYLVAFALILRVIFRLVMRYRKESKKEGDTEQN